MDKQTKRLLFKTLLTRPDFLLSAVVGALALATTYYWLLLQVGTLQMVLDNISREPVYFSVLLILIPTALTMFGLNLGMAILFFRAGGGLKWQGGTLLGALIGGFGAACPACGAFLLSLIGVTAGLSALPFAGLELWALSIGVMVLTLWGSLKTLDRNTCAVEEPMATSCWRLPRIDRKLLVVLFVLTCILVVNLYTMLAGGRLFPQIGARAPAMSDLILQYYSWLSGLFNSVALPIRNLADTINLPLISALLFGLMGATAPCQLSTNVAALAFVTRDGSEPRQIWGHTLAFVAGKVTVYLIIGGLIVALGLQLNQISQTAIPVVVFVRRALGPLLAVIGLFMLGLLQSRLSFGGRFSTWLEAKVGQRQGFIPAYLLGIAFSFAFCPTLFTLFFGLTIPVAIASPGGIIFPGVFAVGTALPVLGLAALMASGRVNIGKFVKRFKSINFWIQRLAGLIFVLVGIHEIILYWLI